MGSRSVVVVTALVAVALLAGCPKSLPKYATVDEARAGLIAARKAALEARDAKEPKKALEAAERAKDALTQAEALAGATGASTSTPDPLLDLRKAEREARYAAQEADERARMEDQLSGLTARAYRGVRGVAVAGFFKGLGLAASQADARGLAALPAPVQSNALVAAGWAQSSLGRKPLPDGSPDWKGIAVDMDALSATPPADLAITLAIGFTLLGKSGLALVESESIDPTTVKDPVARLPLHLVRAFARNSNGYRRLAILEVEEGMAAAKIPTGEEAPVVAGVPVTGAEIVGSMHLLLGAFYVHEKDLAAADRELALALQAWPENPLGEFVTGERLLASGEREKAADCMETAVKGQGEDSEWLAKELAARARAVRDGQADADDGLLCNPTLMAKLALHALWKAADTSPQAAQARAKVAGARAMATSMIQKIPGMGPDAAPVGSGS